MKVYFVQYKDLDGFTDFIPNTSSLPIFSDIKTAQKFLDQEIVKATEFLKGTPIFKRTLFGAPQIIGYNKPPEHIHRFNMQIVKTAHIAISNINPVNVSCLPERKYYEI